MKIKSFVLVAASILGVSAKAENHQVLQLKIESQNREDLLRATTIIDRLASGTVGFDYEFQINSKKKAADLSISNSGAQTIEEIIQLLKNEFGSDVEIRKVPVMNMSIGTQDDQTQ